MLPVKLCFSWWASFSSSCFNLHRKGVWGSVWGECGGLGYSRAGASTHLVCRVLLQPCCSIFSRTCSSIPVRVILGAEPQCTAPCPSPHHAPAQGALNGSESTQPNTRMGEGDLPTLSLQDGGGEAEKGDEQWGGHRCGPLLQKAPRTWAAPQSPHPRPPGPQPFPIRQVQDKDGVPVASLHPQQPSPTKAMVAPKPQPGSAKELHWQRMRARGEEEGVSCIRFTIKVVKPWGQGFCFSPPITGTQTSLPSQPMAANPSKQPASQEGHRHAPPRC